MSPEHGLLTAAERRTLEHTVLHRERLEEQYIDLEQQHQAAATGMWVFLATEVMFFGAIFTALGIYRMLYAEAFEKASEKLNWIIGGTNTLVLLTSSLTVVLAVHFARHGSRRALVTCLALTALLGTAFLGLKGVEYYIDYQENLIPGWRFSAEEWIEQEGLTVEQVGQVKLFLTFYWVMTLVHALHMTIGIGAVLVIMVLARRGHFSEEYYSPVDVTALYWHFVDIVWIFLLPMLYLLGTHSGKQLGL
jgi:cytochrome c oxidase subunit III